MTRRELIKQCGFALTALAMPFPLITFSKDNSMTDKKQFDVIIIGGSYAGLSAAMALGRSLKNVLIIDSGKPCNRYTPHSHNFITQDGSVPGEIATKAKEQVLKYDTVKFLEGYAAEGKKTENGFEIAVESGERFSAQKLIFATGVKDIFPDIKGFEECWGKTVIHCPYCHGYEFKGAKTAVIAEGDRAFHVASLVNNLTDKITIVTRGKADFTEEQSVKLKNHQINIIEKEIEEIKHQNGNITALIFEDGTQENFDAAYAAIPFEQHCKIPLDLGCEITETGLIKVDMFQQTTVPGVYACGDNINPLRSVANAVSSGNITGAMVNHRLTEEKF
ncbi:NAD(P)/FAD-dependent oxidoreductase [Sphingobacterium sp. SGL-16]|uniref:NAD(P)/FAD-dependent oxidoreductase n=1 Tax=Sphingobacterium sp. SGL-16 TaxID=2710883 RepID=UPI0019D248A2|nr:NAD(P)/FAD-dependent oxidoreductase [Sphingobacterium sp. SGL-16]